MVCPTPLSVCGMACVDTRYDPDHCGACGRACPPFPNMTRTCGNGACVPGVCVTGFADCNGMNVDGCEVSTRSDPNNCGACGRACATLPNAAAACTDGACVIGTCGPGFASCDGNASNGCEVDLRADRMNCGACGNVCPGTCRDGVCAESLHNSLPFTATMTPSNGCQFNNTHQYRYQNLGSMPWRECVREASRRGAMLAPSEYTTPQSGWGGHRRANFAMTGRWPTYQEAAITGSEACVIARDHRATTRDAALSDTVSYDGQTWRFQDYGPRFFDECQLLAANAGAMLITPHTLGRTTGDNYWVPSQHTYNTYSWITPGGSGFGHNDVGCSARSSMQRCMVGYVDN
jgi:hypothetical protein